MSKQELFDYGQGIVMAFSPPVVGCMVKKGLQKGGGGHRHPRAPLATPLKINDSSDRPSDPQTVNNHS